MILDRESLCFQSLRRDWRQALMPSGKLRPSPAEINFIFRARLLHVIACQVSVFPGQSLLVEWEQVDERSRGKKRFVKRAYLARLETHFPTEAILACTWKLTRAKRRSVSFRISVRAKRTLGHKDFAGSLKPRLLLDPFLDTLDPVPKGQPSIRRSRILVGTVLVKRYLRGGRTKTRVLLPLL